MRSPDWRWQQASAVLQAQNQGIQLPVPQDRLVNFCLRAQRASQSPASRIFLTNKMPDIWHVIRLGTMDTSSPLRCDIQSCIIDGLTSAQTAGQLKWITQLQVRLYGDVFMDLSGVRAIHGWMQHMLFQPVQNGESEALFRSRILTYYYGRQVGRNAYRFGSNTQDARRAMKSMWQNERGKRIFGYIAKKLNVPAQVYMSFMQPAIKAYQDRQFARQIKAGQSAQSKSIMELATGIQEGIRHFTRTQLQAGKKANIGGEDPINGLIKQIIQSKEDKNGSDTTTG